jgi:hypothetical protein
MTGWLLSASLVAAAAGLAVVYVSLVRPWLLRWGATAGEAYGLLPGDDLVADLTGQATHAVSVNAPASEVWPWLVQLGQDRGGFYSYCWLENLCGLPTRNASRVVPGWQHLEVTDGVLFHPQSPRALVAVLEPNYALVLASLPDVRAGRDVWLAASATWAFVLREQGDGRTRLIIRGRNRWPLGLRLLWEPAHFVMERKLLLTVKGLAEASARALERRAKENGWGRLIHA